MAADLLPNVLSRLRQQAPGIVIDVVASDVLSDWRRREADIAIGHMQPDQPDLIGRWIREASASVYASRAWVAKSGHPRKPEEAARHGFVGSDRSGRDLGFPLQHGLPLETANVVCDAENTGSNWSLVRQGLGIGALMDDIARDTPDVVRVLNDVAPVRFPIWLVTHRELRTLRRIRMAFDMRAGSLGAEPQAVGAPGAGRALNPVSPPRGVVPLAKDSNTDPVAG